MKRTGMLISLIVAAALLGGCPPRDAAPTPPPVAEAPIESPTPTPEPTRPAVGELVLTTEGLDYLTVGAPVEDRPEDVAIAIWTEALCDTDDGGKRGAWTSNYPEGDEAFYFTTLRGERDGVVGRIMAKSPQIMTPEGIHRGSTEADVLAAYPDAHVLTDNPGINRYIVEGTAGRLIIEVGRATDDTDYEKGIVAFMSSASLDNGTWGIANTGAGATCGT